ncbi:type II toxin-antitoxin system RelE/ParE family toxin [Paraglaciecola sp. MB-3u-78]|uniref:type II toxin-antitoxin system RelE/ParE family toxin n=1 Tax=Paraglaciecola sp. MB-3u-78 TaxID=2058332 RepID=UPI000C3267C2|nr:plasmid stabilization protein [Paraglaciecola sp. MB-3u-78]
MFTLSLHPDVKSDTRSSYDCYQLQAQGLGNDFIAELESAFDTISSLPQTWPKFGANHHRFLLSRFPFSVIYQIQSKHIYIIAIMHNSKRPGY